MNFLKLQLLTTAIVMMTATSMASSQQSMVIQGAQFKVCEKQQDQIAFSSRKCIQVNAKYGRIGNIVQLISLQNVRVEQYEGNRLIESESYSDGYYDPKRNIILVWKKEYFSKIELFVDMTSADSHRLEMKQ